MSLRTVNHKIIDNDYPGCKVLSVEEYYKPVGQYLTVLPNGDYCFDTQMSIDEVIVDLYKAGATTVNLKIETRKKKTVFQDYFLKSLIA